MWGLWVIVWFMGNLGFVGNIMTVGNVFMRTLLPMNENVMANPTIGIFVM